MQIGYVLTTLFLGETTSCLIRLDSRPGAVGKCGLLRIHTRDLPAHTQLARYFTHLVTTSTTATFNVRDAAPGSRGGSLSYHLGDVLGADRALTVRFLFQCNAVTVYTRAMCSDYDAYDDWERVHNPG